MECDIILEIGGKESYKIGRESSEKELDSIQDIVEFLQQKPINEVKDLIQRLQTSSVRIKNSQKDFQGKQLIGNCSIDNLRIKFPEETKLLNGIEKPYIITLVDKAYSNGDELKGRVVVNGVVSYVLRNKFDVQNFALTEYKKHLVEQTINDNVILDQYLSDKYQDKLNIIRNHYKKNISNLTKEMGEFKEFTIKALVLDYLNNTSQYNDIIKQDNVTLDSGSILHDFCREINKQQVINEDSESDLARALRRLHYKREEFGKLELYEVLQNFIPGFTEKISKQQFINLNTEDMESLLQEYFKDDVILNNYYVDSVDITTLEKIRLTQKQVKELIKNTIKQKNQSLKQQGKTELPSDYEVPKEELADFLVGQTIEVNGLVYPVTVSTENEQIVCSYIGKKINNNSKIKLKRKSKPLKDQFNFGYNTLNIFNPVNEEGVVDGKYNGYYIYSHIKDNKDTIYIISQSVISPNLFNVPQFKSLKDAKLAVDGFNRSANILKATKLGLKQIQGDFDRKRYVQLEFSTNSGQTIDVINYPIQPKISLPSQEYKLANEKKMGQIIEYYKQFGIDISSFTLPEQVGTFLYAMVQEGFSINYLQNNEIPIDSINTIINNILEKETVQYLVERSTEIKGKYITYIKSLSDSGITVNSTGTDLDGNNPTQSLTSTMWNLKDTLENTLFKDTPIQIEITDNSKLKELKDGNGEYVFQNGVDNVRAFIFNNTLYINQSVADVSDMLHETFHILLGSIKAQDLLKNESNYKKIIEYIYSGNKISKTTKNRVNEQYANLAEIDRMEEAVVRYLARQVENGDMFYYDKTDDVIKLIMNQFQNLTASIRNSMKIDLSSDIGFQSNIQTLISENINIMKENRIITNIIEKGIKEGKIIEDCR